MLSEGEEEGEREGEREQEREREQALCWYGEELAGSSEGPPGLLGKNLRLVHSEHDGVSFLNYRHPQGRGESWVDPWWHSLG